MPQEYGGQRYGLEEGATVQHEIAHSGAANAYVGMSGTQIFNAAPLITFGTDEQKELYLPDIASGESRLVVAVTEPNAGLDTSRTTTMA